MTKDYYKILGVTEFDTAENIKSAYRKLARKYHPDIAGNGSDVLSKFKEINEAYEILSNKIKKEEYDRTLRFYSYAKSNKTVHEQRQEEVKKETARKGFSFSWEDFIKNKKRENSFREEKNITPKNGEDINSDIDITIFEAMAGTTKTINMLQTQVCPYCKGKKFVNGGICKHCNGKGNTADYKKFSVKIPQGVTNNSKIRLAGEGNKGVNGGRNGDLYLTIHIVEPQNYKTDGLNIIKTIPITPYEAVLGANIKIATLNGNVIVKVAPNTQNGQKIRLTGCGIVQN
ncbi:MAG: DnaJ domain-containing protein, partial [bacterium]|nr:DnaJ domain-containing protein [bacterium]